MDVELFVRSLQEVRRFKSSTVSRRLSVVICFYRTCVIGAVLEQSPADYVRRPPVARAADLRGLRRYHRRPRWGTRPPGPRAVGKGTKTALVPLPPAVGRAVDRAVADRTSGPILLNRAGNQMDLHAATRRLNTSR